MSSTDHHTHVYTPAHKHSTSLSSTFSTPDPEKPWHTPTPRVRRTSNELLSLILSRSRFLLRLLSSCLSATSLALITSNTLSFHRTRSKNLIYAGILIWPTSAETLDLTATNALLAAMALASTLSVALLAAGLWPRVRHVSTLGDTLAAAVAASNIVCAIFGAVFFVLWSPEGGVDLKSWTCGHTVVKHPEVDFERVCAELAGAWGVCWAVVAVEVLTVANVLLAVVMVKRGGDYGKFVRAAV